MSTLRNEILINAPIEKIWKELASLERLANYDPGAKESNVLTEINQGIGAKRRVNMIDGKNWFEETCTIYKENSDLKYELTSCSFPVNNLYHRYSFEKINDHSYKVAQTQSFKMKYGILGKVMAIMIKPKWNKGIQGFLKGLKEISEEK